MYNNMVMLFNSKTLGAFAGGLAVLVFAVPTSVAALSRTVTTPSLRAVAAIGMKTMILDDGWQKAESAVERIAAVYAGDWVVRLGAQDKQVCLINATERETLVGGNDFARARPQPRPHSGKWLFENSSMKGAQ